MTQTQTGNYVLKIKYLKSPIGHALTNTLYRFGALTPRQAATLIKGGYANATQQAMTRDAYRECTQAGLIAAYELTAGAKQATYLISNNYPAPRPLDLRAQSDKMRTHTIRANQLLVSLVENKTDEIYLDTENSYGAWSRLHIPKVAPLRPTHFLTIRTPQTRTLCYLTYYEGNSIAELNRLMRYWRIALAIRAESVGGSYAQTKTPCPASLIVIENADLLEEARRTLAYKEQTGPYLASADQFRLDPYNCLLYPAGHDARAYHTADMLDLTYWHGTTNISPIWPVHTPDPYGKT